MVRTAGLASARCPLPLSAEQYFRLCSTSRSGNKDQGIWQPSDHLGGRQSTSSQVCGFLLLSSEFIENKCKH